MPAEDDNVVTVAVEGTGEHGANLPGTARDDDLHRFVPERVCARRQTMV
jgi:hypothetical protein